MLSSTLRLRSLTSRIPRAAFSVRIKILRVVKSRFNAYYLNEMGSVLLIRRRYAPIPHLTPLLCYLNTCLMIGEWKFIPSSLSARLLTPFSRPPLPYP